MAETTYHHDIFLSYAREDRDRVKLLANTLASLGWSVWWDRRIPTGKRFAKVIEEQLEASRTIVVVWSKISVQSDWVHTEADEGLRRGVLFPLMIDEVRIPLEFRRVQAADLIHWQGDTKNEQWQLLVSDLSFVLGLPPGSLSSVEPKDQKEAEPKAVETSLEKLEGKTGGPPNQTVSHPPEDMVPVLKGPFLYGYDKKTVVINHDYYLDVNPVTNAACAKFLEGGGYESESYWTAEGWKWRTKENIQHPEYWTDATWNQADHPVVGVSYYEAEAYAKWAGRPLPTEQEWEKAARGTDGRTYPWGEEFDPGLCACSVKGKRERPVPVGTFPEGASPYGCQDMAGNVREWTNSWMSGIEAKEVLKKNGLDPSKYGIEDQGQYRVLRGGSWPYDDPENFRCANRNLLNLPRNRNYYIGFRCAQDAP